MDESSIEAAAAWDCCFQLLVGGSRGQLANPLHVCYCGTAAAVDTPPPSVHTTDLQLPHPGVHHSYPTYLVPPLLPCCRYSSWPLYLITAAVPPEAPQIVLCAITSIATLKQRGVGQTIANPDLSVP